MGTTVIRIWRRKRGVLKHGHLRGKEEEKA